MRRSEAADGVHGKFSGKREVSIARLHNGSYVIGLRRPIQDTDLHKGKVRPAASTRRWGSGYCTTLGLNKEAFDALFETMAEMKRMELLRS